METFDTEYMITNDVEAFSMQVDDLICEVENLRFEPNRASLVALSIKQFIFECYQELKGELITDILKQHIVKKLKGGNGK